MPWRCLDDNHLRCRGNLDDGDLARRSSTSVVTETCVGHPLLVGGPITDDARAADDTLTGDLLVVAWTDVLRITAAAL